MAVISWYYRYLFVHSPRTGGTALAEEVLVPQLAGEHLPPEPIEVRKGNGTSRSVRQHATPAQLIETGLLEPSHLSQLLVLTTVRNPFDTIVSGWVKRRRGIDLPWASRDEVVLRRMRLAQELSFPEYVEHKFGDKHRPRHFYAAQIEHADVVMRFERLQADFDGVADRLRLGHHVEIPRRNVTEGRSTDYREYYTPETRAIVERLFAPDLERFGYEF